VPNLKLRPDVPLEHSNEREHRRLIARRANIGLPTDGSGPMRNPLLLETYTVATLPTASLWTQGLIYVSDETGGATIAFSDGTNWRRVQDRAIVS
jgi:hypothetical protein